MTYNITEITSYDNKRNKVTLDYGEVAFLLYKGECRQLGLKADSELTEENYRKITEEILTPRAQRRVLYYLKNGDKTRHQIREKLKEGHYPEPVIEKVMTFLEHYGIADDRRFAENYITELKGSRSRREIQQKLMQKGLKGADIRQQLDNLSPEEEYAACLKALQKKYPHGLTFREEMPAEEETGEPSSGSFRRGTRTQAETERNRAYGYLARRGFGYDAIEYALNHVNDADT